MTTADILRQAADRVDRKWGKFRLDDGCALAAIAEAVMGHSLFAYTDPRVKEVRRYAEGALRLPERQFPDSEPICAWNDAPRQTAENVAQGLRFAALLWEEEHPDHVREDSIVDALLKLRMELW